MLNIMTKDPNFVSVRLPDDVAFWLREYATVNKLIRADKPNMGGSIIAIVRSVMQGQTISNNVGQSSAAPDVDIKTMIDEAINSRLVIIESKVQNLQSDQTSEKTEALLIEALQTNLAIANHRIDDLSAKIAALSSEATAPANFTSALLQKAKAIAPLKLMELAKAS